MGLIKQVADGFRVALGLKRSIDLSNPALRPWLFGTEIAGAGILSTSQAWQNPHVRACVEANAQAVATRPVMVYRGQDPIESHWLLELLKAPNPELALDGYELKYQTFALRELFGECFWVLERGGVGGKPKAIWVYNPGAVQDVIDRGTGKLLAWSFQLEQRKFVLPIEDVVHFRRYDPTKHLPTRPTRGSSPLLSVLLAASSDQAAARYNLDFFTRGATPGAIFINEDDLSFDNEEEFLSKLKVRLQGKGHEPIVLGGKWKYQSAAMTAKDAEFIAGRMQNRSDIAEAFGVPPVVLGKDDASYANAEIQLKIWGIRTLLPIAQNWNAAVNQRLLAKEANITCEISTDGLGELEASFASRIEQAGKLWAMGVPLENIDELLDLGLGEFEGKETGYLPFSVAPASLVSDTSFDDPIDTPEGDPDDEATSTAGDQPTGTKLEEGLQTSVTLNGIQVNAAIGVLQMVKNDKITDIVAIGLLVGLGIPREEAEAMVASMHELPPDPVEEPAPAAPAAPKPTDDEDDRSLDATARRILTGNFLSGSVGDVAAVGERIIAESRASSTASKIKTILELIRDDDDLIKEISARFFQQGMKVGADQIAKDLGLSISFDLKNPRAKAFLEKKLIQIVDINKTTEKKLRKLLTKALEDGLTAACDWSEISG